MQSSIKLPTGHFRHLDPGPLRPLVDQFTEYLASLGHTALTVRGYDDAACHFLVWLQQSGTGIGHAGDDTCAAFATHRCQCPGIRRSDRVSAKYARRACRFVRFLSERGIVGRLTLPGPMPMAPLVSSFQDWLRLSTAVRLWISRTSRAVVAGSSEHIGRT